MAKAGVGWIHTASDDHFQDFLTRNVPKRIIQHKKVQHLPPIEIHYDSPHSPTGKEWTDQSLLSYRSVNKYLADSDAFQRTSLSNILDKWNEHKVDKTSQLISSFDCHYNMKTRFRHDEQLNRTSEMKYASGAGYYRFIGTESNPKNHKPCGRHKRRTQEYNERHLRELLKLPTAAKSRSTPYFLPKRTPLPSIDSSSLVISSEFSEEPSVDISP